MIASIPDIDSFPKIVLAAADCCALLNFPNLVLNSSRIVINGFTDPFVSVIEMPNFFICSFIESVGLAKLAIAVFKAVPACEPLIPAFAIKPTARAVSSTLNPNVPARGATYLNVSPIKETFVFALDDVLARTSAKCDESSAFNPKAVNASVTISLVFAKLSPEAAARFKIPGNPSIICCVFHPAIAI